MKRSTSRLLGALAAIGAALSQAPAQNLVPNPGFENFSTCPNAPDQINRCDNWVNPSVTSPEYMHACAPSIVDVPSNLWGNQQGRGPSSAYAACVVYRAGNEFREYVQVKLTSPLAAGTDYDVSFRVSLADKSTWMIADLGAHLSTSAVSSATGWNIPVTPQIANSSTSILSDATGWTQISGTYTASGGEEWLTLGNFKNNAATNAQSRSGSIIYAVYYFDDVVVEKKASSGGNAGGLVATPHLVGWSDVPMSTSAGYVDIQDVDGACKPATTVCRTLPLNSATTPWAGGTAYDSRYQTIWASDGVALTEQYLSGTTKSCRQRCATIKPARANTKAFVSGLAVADRRQELFQLATTPGYMEIVVYDNRKCPVQRSVCRQTLPQNTLAAGLAYDEARDLLYWTVSSASATGYSNALYVSLASKPCAPICKFPLDFCSGNLITGVAYDACSKHLYLTDGQVTRTMTAVDPRNCKFTTGACCKKQRPTIYRGLAVIPGWTKKSVGTSCTTAPCASCPSMAASCVGDPALGTGFRMTLQGAPVGGFGVLFVKVGPCGSGFAFGPPFCGRFYAAPVAISFPAQPLLGSGTCGGAAGNTLNIPANPALCGGTLCAQWWVFCRGPRRFGFGFSDAMEFTITGSSASPPAEELLRFAHEGGSSKTLATARWSLLPMRSTRSRSGFHDAGAST